jgi:hypothetical protein
MQLLLEAVRKDAESNGYGNVSTRSLAKMLRREVTISELRPLVQHGWIWAKERFTNGAKKPFLTFELYPMRQAGPYPIDDATVDREIADACAIARSGSRVAAYVRVREQFLWFDDAGKDLFRAQAERLAVAGVCQFETDQYGRESFDLTTAFAHAATAALAPLPDLTPFDFQVLNALEDEEAERINFGAPETFTPPSRLASNLSAAPAAVLASIERLHAQRYLLWVDDAGERAVRSRMGEMARVVRLVKQRFNNADAGTRPFVVRALRVRVRNRRKPTRNRPLCETIDELKQSLSNVPHALDVLEALQTMLAKAWNSPSVMMAEFQRRGLREILPAYLGIGGRDAFVITADTGSGKTETAFFPLIAGAAIDTLSGRRGTKAILTYPRLRLAYNQAQRMAEYLALLAAQPGMPTLSLGLQSGDVRESAAAVKTTTCSGRR